MKKSTLFKGSGSQTWKVPKKELPGSVSGLVWCSYCTDENTGVQRCNMDVPKAVIIQRRKLKSSSKLFPLHHNHHKTLLRKNVEYIEKVSPQTFRQNKGDLYNEKCHSTDTTKYQGSLFLGLIFNLWLQIICHYLENKRSHYLHSSLQPQSYTLFSYKIRVGRGLRRYTEDKSEREQTLLQA